jgi:hypothetical protein
MSEVHYFPRYSQLENVVTNNTLLLLLRLHQYNRFKFEKFMGLICAEDDVQLPSSWLQFRQQKGTGKSVVDGFIAQDSIKIVVETKLTPTFDLAQLENHLNVFDVEQHKLLILLSPLMGDGLSGQLVSIRKKAALKNISVVHTSFEDIVEKTRKCLSDHDEEMLALASDFEVFCSENNLLPRDQYSLFVPPCGLSFEANERFRLYYCPAIRSHRDAKYLGIYAQKKVRAIGQISKVVACTVNTATGKVSAENEAIDLTDEEKERILGAVKEAETREWDLTTGHKFYLCDSLEPTDFLKISPGGIVGHRNFDLEKVLGNKVPKDLSTIARSLRQRTWE